MNIKKNDMVLVISGKDRGKKGKVRRSLPRDNRIVVEGLNMIKRHSRARRAARQAGIVELEAPLHASNVMLLCSKCKKPARVGFRTLEDGRKVRFCRTCQEVLD
ncbi:MAG: 50S ribosomal protein L24 [Dehalococcoidia bacterium]|nr:50S ribosomal protein L24 [Dehalococcoidia bacterium]